MRNGSLLLSVIGRPEVHLVNPLVIPATANVVASIPDANAVFGIVETRDDIFAVAAGNVTPANVPVQGSFSIWTIDLTNKHEQAEVSKLASVPNVSMINGMAALNTHTLLLADSWAGNIASLDTLTGESEVWFDNASTAANFSAPRLPLGVNGIRVHDDFVYYSNTVLSSLSRVRVDVSTGKVTGEVETLAKGEEVGMPDDFAVLEDGSVILGRPMNEELVRVGKDGKVKVVARAEGITAVAAGMTTSDKNVVYLSSMGGFNGDGSVKAGGRVIALELE
jgi:hypothetical protein